MRLLLDMNLPPRATAALADAKHDAIHARDHGLVHAADPQLIARAVADRRAVVTFDLDFPRLVALSREPGPSLVVFRLEAFTTDQLIARLLAVLREHRQPIDAGAIVIVESHRLRIRTLPLLDTTD